MDLTSITARRIRLYKYITVLCPVLPFCVCAVGLLLQTDHHGQILMYIMMAFGAGYFTMLGLLSDLLRRCGHLIGQRGADYSHPRPG